MFCHLYWFAAATQGKYFLFWNSNIYVIKIGIRIRNSKICNRIRNPNPPIFWPDCHPWFKLSGLLSERPSKEIEKSLSQKTTNLKLQSPKNIVPDPFQPWSTDSSPKWGNAELTTAYLQDLMSFLKHLNFLCKFIN